jgi:hypothetical protein
MTARLSVHKFPFREVAPSSAAIGGALGLGANAITSGGQIELKPEALLRFQIAAPFTTTIYKKNGVQSQLPAAPGTALKVRARGWTTLLLLLL